MQTKMEWLQAVAIRDSNEATRTWTGNVRNPVAERNELPNRLADLSSRTLESNTVGPISETDTEPFSGGIDRCETSPTSVTPDVADEEKGDTTSIAMADVDSDSIYSMSSRSSEMYDILRADVPQTFCLAVIEGIAARIKANHGSGKNDELEGELENMLGDRGNRTTATDQDARTKGMSRDITHLYHALTHGRLAAHAQWRR